MGVLGNGEITMTLRFPLQRLSFNKIVDTGRGPGWGGRTHELNFKGTLSLRYVLNQQLAMLVWSQEERQLWVCKWSF